MRSWRSISPTDCWDETRRLKIARRFGSAMISKTDSILLVYSTEHIRVKVYTNRGPLRDRMQRLICGLICWIDRSGRAAQRTNQDGLRTAEAGVPAPALSRLVADGGGILSLIEGARVVHG